MDITSYPLSERNTSLLLFLMPLSATSGGCAQSIISIISIQACTGLGIASLLECRWCLARINFSPLPQGMKNNPMAKTQAWSSGKILSSLLLCTFPFWPWPRDLLSHREELFTMKVWHKLTPFWLSFLIHLDSAVCIVIPNSGHTEQSI